MKKPWEEFLKVFRRKLVEDSRKEPLEDSRNPKITSEGFPGETF